MYFCSDRKIARVKTRVVLRVIHGFQHAGYVLFKPFTRLHAKEIQFFYSCCSFKSARMQKIFVFAFLHPCILDRCFSLLPAALVSSYRNNLFVCIGITSSKESKKGFGNSLDCGAGSMTEWKWYFENCHVPAVKVADFAHEMKRKWNVPVLKTRIGLSKRIMGSTYLLGHFSSTFTQFSQRSLRYKLVTAWHFSIILNHFLKMRLMKSELFL